MEKDLLEVCNAPSQRYEVHTFANNDFEEERVFVAQELNRRPSYVVYQVN